MLVPRYADVSVTCVNFLLEFMYAKVFMCVENMLLYPSQ
jgi:hypothetical protein